MAMAIMGPITGVELIPSHLRLYIRELPPPLSAIELPQVFTLSPLFLSCAPQDSNGGQVLSLLNPRIPQRETHILVVAGDPVGPHRSPCAISFHIPAGKPLFPVSLGLQFTFPGAP